jgi:dTDP-4-amino-4,6-dideoxygalactose transaminase
VTSSAVPAILGGAPAFSTRIASEPHRAAWERIEDAFRGIFERRYFTNNGPLVRELDLRLSAFFNAHAVCVTNASVGFMILAKGLGLRGEIILPENAPSRTKQSFHFAGLVTVLCPLNERGMLSFEAAEHLVNRHTAAIAGTHALGRACDPGTSQAFARRHNIALLFDATEAMGCSVGGRNVGCIGEGEVFSFHQSTILDGADGGCIVTRDDELAKKLRAIRSFSPTEPGFSVPLRTNGKMSEAQAALALLGLDHLQSMVEANRRRLDAYARGIATMRGLSLLAADKGSNFQYIMLVVEEETFGLNRDQLVLALAAENIVTEPVQNGWAQLPNGPNVDEQIIDRICERLRSIGVNAPSVRAKVREHA